MAFNDKTSNTKLKEVKAMQLKSPSFVQHLGNVNITKPLLYILPEVS